MSTISLKTKYVRTDGWRGYSEQIYAVCGANDTGTFSDSPCPSNVCKEELDKAKKILRANKIKFKTTVNQTSNLFCVHRYIVTSEEDHDRAIDLIQPIIADTRLLYTTDKLTTAKTN